MRKRQLVFSGMELLDCSHHRFDESCAPQRAECYDPVEIDFYGFFDMQSIQTLSACRVAWKTFVYLHGHSCLMYSANG